MQKIVLVIFTIPTQTNVLAMTGRRPAYYLVVICALLTLSILVSDVNAKSIKRSPYNSSHGVYRSHATPTYHSGNTYSSGRSTSHGYPSSNSLSGSESHGSYATNRPNSHGYPSKPNSLSGTGNTYYPSGTKPGTAPYPSANYRVNSSSSHGYPSAPSNSLSGGSSGFHYVSSNKSLGSSSQSYPPSNGYSGNTYISNSNYNSNRGSSSYGNSHHTVVHHHYYVYHPPRAIHYGTQHISYPVYTGTPPSYVYEYRGSENKYRNLLAGLALYNLGRMSTTPDSHQYHVKYIPRLDEYCTFIVKSRTGRVDQMNIDCRAITYFIYEEQPRLLNYVTKDIANRTAMTSQSILPNGNLVNPAYVQNGQVMQQVLSSNGQVMPNGQQANTFSSTNVLSVNDDRLNGRPVEVKTDMECFVTRQTSYIRMEKPVPCDLLEKYSASSLRASGAMVKSSLMIIAAALLFVLY